MNILRLYNKPTNNVYYVSDDIIYKIDKKIDEDDCSKYISVQDISSYNIKQNEVPFVSMQLNVSCFKDVITYENSQNKSLTLWNNTFYLDNLISEGDKLNSNGRIIPNPEHNKINYIDRLPLTYVDVLNDFYITNIINDFVNGKSLNEIYKSLPIYCKQYDNDQDVRYNTIIKKTYIDGTSGTFTNDLSVGLFATRILTEDNKIHYHYFISKKLENYILKYFTDKYTKLITDEFNKINMDVNVNITYNDSSSFDIDFTNPIPNNIMLESLIF